MENYHKIAAQMLNLYVYDLPPDLSNMLDEVSELINMANGTLSSRQAIAIIIMSWRLKNRG